VSSSSPNANANATTASGRQLARALAAHEYALLADAIDADGELGAGDVASVACPNCLARSLLK
jgi:hypothetical protein